MMASTCLKLNTKCKCLSSTSTPSRLHSPSGYPSVSEYFTHQEDVGFKVPSPLHCLPESFVGRLYSSLMPRRNVNTTSMREEREDRTEEDKEEDEHDYVMITL